MNGISTPLRARVLAAPLLGLPFAAVACAPPSRVSDGWAVTAGQGGGGFVDRGRPTEGKPLATVAVNRAACLSDAQLLSVLGKPCDHETENTRQPATGDLEPGIPAPTPEVRWYCGGDLVVRVVLERCDPSGGNNLDGVRPLEIAVVTHP